MITSDDKQMVNAIDRVIGSKVERRTLTDFDYNAPAPKKHMRAWNRGRP